jgi:hypothetical protein
LIFSSINAEADSTWTGLSCDSSNSRTYLSCAQRNMHLSQLEASSGSVVFADSLQRQTADRRSQVRVRTCAFRRSFRNKSSKDMAFPHPESRKNKDRKEDKPNSGGVIWNLFERTVNITEYRNGKDDVNPAKNCPRAWSMHCFAIPRFTTSGPP